MPHDNPLAFSTLTPDELLDALESVGLQPDGRLLALNSFENRVYQVGMEEGPPLIAKFYRPGRWSDAAILEEHAYSSELAAREIPVVPPCVVNGQTLHHHAEMRFAVFARQPGRVPELEDGATLEWLGRFLGRIHAVGALQDFAARPALTPEYFGTASRDFLLQNDFLPPDLLAAWQSVADQALDGVAACYARVGKVDALRLHGDCHRGNVLWMEGPFFVDFDDCMMGPAVQDLWMLLSGDPEAASIQLGHLLRGYEQFREFDDRELGLVEALRTLRLLHYSAWLARRWGDPAFAVAFPWFNTQRYWQERILELREQVAAMQEPPLRAAMF